MRETESRPALRITITYALFAGLWILLSDRLLFLLVREGALLTRLQTYKGWAFVLTSATLLFFLLSREIRARDQVERSHRESEERYRILIEQAADGIFIANSDGKLLDVNPSGYSMLGYARQEILNLNLLDLLAPDDGAEFQPRLSQVQPGSFIVHECCLIGKDGAFLPVEMSVKRLTSGRLQAIIRDISERKQAEQALHTWANIFQHTKTGVAISSPVDERLRLVNPSFAAMHGYSVSEMTGKRIGDLFVPEDHTEIPEQVRLAHDEGHSMFEASHMRKDGTTFPVLVNVSMVKNDAGNVLYWIMSVQDITERKQAEENLQRQLQRMAALRAIDVAISATLDLRLTFDVFLDQVSTQPAVDAVSILLFNEQTQRLEFTDGRGFLTPAIRQSSLRMGEGLAGRVAQERRSTFIADLARPEFLFSRSALLVGENFVTYSGIPLVAKGQLKGVLEIYSRARIVQDPQWLDFLEAIAGQAAIAIENATLYENLQRSSLELALAYDATLEGWSRALELRDRETQGHSDRVTELTLQVAQEMGLKPSDLVHVRRGTLLHDIGKMGVPDSILLKPGPLNPEEWEIMRRHPLYAFEMLAPIEYLRPAMDIPYCHHERWDGTGYPRGLEGEQIPMAARIFSVIDVWDALLSNRPYRSAWSEVRVREYILSKAGRHFDPLVVKIFMQKVFAEKHSRAAH